MDVLTPEVNAVIREYAYLAGPRVRRFSELARLKLMARTVGLWICPCLTVIGVIAQFFSPSLFRPLILCIIPTFLLLKRFDVIPIYLKGDIGQYIGYQQSMSSGNYRAAVECAFQHISAHEKRSFIGALNRAGAPVNDVREALLLLADEHDKAWKTAVFYSLRRS